MIYHETEHGVLYCGDCLEILPTLEVKADMILCDLPYGTTACKWDVIIPFEPLWEQYKRIIKDNGAIVLTASQPFTSALVMSNVKDFRYNLIWNKHKSSSALHAKIQPLRIHEDIVIFSKNKTVYNPQMVKGKPRVDKESKISNGEAFGNNIVTRKYENKEGLYYPKSILDISNADQTNKVHPTQKPVALFEYLIKTYTNEGDLVLDNCAGSGTTAIAAIRYNRRYIMIEKEEKYCEIAAKRIETELNQTDIFREAP
jgi:site-specific DNA-methyltransferase (adenine-specific)